MFEDKAETCLSEAKLLEKKAALVAEVDRIGRKVSEAEAILAAAEKKQHDIDALTTEYAELSGMVLTAKNDYAFALAKLDETTAKTKAQKAVLDHVKVQLEEAKAALVKLQEDFVLKQKELAVELSVALVNVETSKSSLSLLEKEVVNKSQENDVLEKAKGVLIAEIDAAKDALEALKGSKEETEAQLSDLLADVAKTTGVLEDLKQEVKASEAERLMEIDAKVETLAILDEQQKEKESALAKREDAVTVREGEASKKEEWLESDRKALRNAKDELAAFYKRDIPINI